MISKKLKLIMQQYWEKYGESKVSIRCSFVLDGELYEIIDGVLYKKVKTNEGEVFKVIY